MKLTTDIQTELVFLLHVCSLYMCDLQYSEWHFQKWINYQDNKNHNLKTNIVYSI